MAGLVDGRCLRSVSPLNDVGRCRVYSHARNRSPPEGKKSLAFSLGWLGALRLSGGSDHWRVEDLPTDLPTLCHPSSPSLAFSSSGGSLVFYPQGRVSRVMLQTGRFPTITSRFTPNSDPIILSRIGHLRASLQPRGTRSIGPGCRIPITPTLNLRSGPLEFSPLNDLRRHASTIRLDITLSRGRGAWRLMVRLRISNSVIA